MIFQGIQTSIAIKPYFLIFLQGGPDPMPPPPSESAHVSIGPVDFRCLVVFVMFIQILKEHYGTYVANSGNPDQMTNHAASDLNLHCLSRSQNKDTSFLCVNL